MSMSSSPTTNMRQARSGARAAETSSRLMSAVFAFVERIAAPFLRVSLAVILFWIGALKYFHPAPIVGLLQASFLLRFLATNGFAYLLGTLEILAAVLLLSNIAVRYVGLLVVLLFVGTLTIFVTAPAVTYGAAGFPNLSLAGQFLLKDLALAGATLTIVAHDVKWRARQAPKAATPLRSEME
jgi:reactive chlorine resistance protein C